MVVGVFPIAKLGALLLKQASKPIATFAKERAKQSPFFRTYICMPPAQFYNWCEVKMKMWIMNLGKPDTVPSLNEQMAIELGANLLGEGIIFVIAAGIIYAEYARQVRKELAKEALKEEEMGDIHCHIRDLSFRLESQDAQIRQLMHMIADLDSRVVRIPWKGASKPLNVESKADTQNKQEPNAPNITKPSVVSEAIGYASNVISDNNTSDKKR